MKMWSMRVIILLLFCYGCLSTDSKRVKFNSTNFFNILQWEPVKPSYPGEKILYTVWYKSDAVNQTYKVKEECRNITALSCNLTLETPSEHDVYYRAKVNVGTGLCLGDTYNFKPIAYTTFGAPTLSINTTVSSLHINATLPLGPHGVSIADIIARSKKGPSKPGIIYTLEITHPTWAKLVNESKTGRFVINLKNNRTEYCGFIVYKPNAEWGRHGSERAQFCVKLPEPQPVIWQWLLVGAALLAAIVAISAVFACNYVKGGKKKILPPTLETGFSFPPATHYPDPNLVISKSEIFTPSDQTVYATIRVKPNAPAAVDGGYSPQDINCQAWESSIDSSVDSGADSQEPGPDPEDTSAQSSQIYSVVTVHVPAAGEGKDNQEVNTEDRDPSGGRWDRGGTSPPESPDPAEINPAGPLLLDAVRDANGQLMLPSLAFQLQGSTGDTAKIPLLSLASVHSFDGSEWSDSGCEDSTVNTPTQLYCNSNYCPSQPAAPYFRQTPCTNTIFESGYKQNWMPSIPFVSESRDGREYIKTKYPWEEEQEEEGDMRGEEMSRQSLLGSLVVQIQE